MTLLSAFRDNDYKLVSGFNLPMIIEALSQNQMDLTLEEIADRLIDNGRNLSIRLVDKIQTDEMSVCETLADEILADEILADETPLDETPSNKTP